MKGTATYLTDFEDVDDDPDLDELTDAEREVYDAVVEDGHGVREYGRKTDREPGTVGNLLGRARDKLEDSDE